MMIYLHVQIYSSSMPFFQQKMQQTEILEDLDSKQHAKFIIQKNHSHLKKMHA